MGETFLILLAGGLVLAAARSPSTLARGGAWRFTAYFAIAMCAVSLYFYFGGRPVIAMPPLLRRVQLGLMVATMLAIGVVVALPIRGARRSAARAAFVLAVLAGSNLLHESMFAVGTALHLKPKMLAMVVQTLACAAVAATAGLAFANSLTGGKDGTGAPRTSRRAWLTVLAVRAVFSVSGAVLFQVIFPVDRLWSDVGWFIAIRWGLGLALPIVILARGRREQSHPATDLLVLVGELMALNLTRVTGLPF